MTDEESDDAVISKIVAFATHLSDPASEGDAAVEAARSRGWLDASGAPTASGRELARAIDEQKATRSVIRNV